MFCASAGSPWKGSAVSHGIKKLLRKIGRPDVSLHGLRHSTASNMLSLGIHMKVVQELLGHSDFGVTMNIYTHVSPGLQVQAVNQLAEARVKAGISTHGGKFRPQRCRHLIQFYAYNCTYAPVAQRIEHWSSEPGVGGSNPSRRTISQQPSHSYFVCVFPVIFFGGSLMSQLS